MEPPAKLSTIVLFNIKQALLNELKDVLTINDDILRRQKYFWMIPKQPVENETQQNDIKAALESHYRTPTVWISSTKVKINIDPDDRILNKK